MSTAADTLPDFTGCFVDKYYELVQMLGAGSFGVVYKAVDTRESPDSDSRHRAVKIIRKAGRSPKELAIIRREVALHSIVAGHPSIITIHDAIDDDEYFYIMLDYCPGGDLFDHVVDKLTYVNNDELLRRAFVSLIEAVQYCHEHKIAHRDLKPENVLASEDGSKVFLADFGLATVKRMTDEHGSGTSIYMAPECHGKLYGYKPYCTRTADIWALGVIFVNMLSGRNPWEKASMSDLDFAEFIDDPDYLYDALPISEAACDILHDTFALNPLKRITLRKLREAVLNTETFFRPSEAKTSSTKMSGSSSLDVPPGLSPPNSRWNVEEEEDDESPLVTPTGSAAGKSTNIEKVDWKLGSTAQVLMARRRLEEQLGLY
ncbi:kinase-like protein [Polyporus arcularius HHB13444]|uniref:Kinase-like protein n=1 Tax=Polyporus arcularius HHB13444 TaxID=1314778 RepID=A0A5C3P4C1_9APHY|nr:kinase-like protein [Polyporus arcularius HHB13444]